MVKRENICEDTPNDKITTVKNIMTIDVEDWYMDFDISTWDLYEDRVVESTNIIIKLLRESDIKATFFILGYVAEHFPDLVKCIKEEGHEIATHGYGHIPIIQQTPSEFEQDLIKSVTIIEKITGDKIIGYRACQFTIMENTAWAIDILKRNKLKYDSSIFPVKTHLYGVPGAPLYQYRISSININREADSGDNLIEIPLSIFRVPILKKNIPIAGGFYFRLFPYWFIKYAIKKINRNGQPFIFYIHPWEFDPNQPKDKNLKWYHYYKLSNTENKFKKILKDFNFISIREGLFYEK